MNDMIHDTSDDDVRGLLARARADAPAPHGWHEVVERYDHDGGQRDPRHRRPWALAVAAAILAVGCVGLVAALQARSADDADHTPVDEPPPPTFDRQGEVVVVVDPLADLSGDDWVVPGRLPDGYEVIVAMQTSATDRDVVQLLVGGDGIADVTITRGSNGRIDDDEAPDESVDGSDGGTGSHVPVEVIDIDGVNWEVRSLAIDDRVTLEHLQRVVNDRVVSLSTPGSVDVLVEIAADLSVVPDDELDVPRLSFGDDISTTVATFDAAELAAHGVNGVYCLSINTPNGMRATSCGARTGPRAPVTSVVESQSRAGSFSAGLAEPDVARIEFIRTDGVGVVVEPTDVSGSFDNRFWITDQPGVGPAPTIDHAIVTYDDGATATIRSSTHDGAWTLDEQPDVDDGVIAARFTEVQIDAVADMDDVELTEVARVRISDAPTDDPAAVYVPTITEGMAIAPAGFAVTDTGVLIADLQQQRIVVIADDGTSTITVDDEWSTVHDLAVNADASIVFGVSGPDVVVADIADGRTIDTRRLDIGFHPAPSTISVGDAGFAVGADTASQVVVVDASGDLVRRETAPRSADGSDRFATLEARAATTNISVFDGPRLVRRYAVSAGDQIGGGGAHVIDAHTEILELYTNVDGVEIVVACVVDGEIVSAGRIDLIAPMLDGSVIRMFDKKLYLATLTPERTEMTVSAIQTPCDAKETR